MIGMAVLFLGVFGLAFYIVSLRGNQAVQRNFDALVARRASEERAQKRVRSLLQRRAMEAMLAQVDERLEGQAFAQELEQRLRQADLDWRVSEFLALVVAAGVGSFLLLVVLTGNPLFALLFGVGAGAVPFVYVNQRRTGRRGKLELQLPDCLALMSNALRAGYSLLQAMDAVSRELPSPIAQEFGQVVAESGVNIPLEQALESMVQRVKSQDLDLVVTAVLVHRQVGGNLAEVLDRIGDTIRERIKIHGQVRVLTAQGRMSGWIITLLPIGLGIGFWFMDPGYMQTLVSTALGWLLLIVGAVFLIIGALMVRAITQVEV
ncbi:MAG: type II secretion system F family protein [Thermaerobacter sp.]|nr:type II secretion system F family protein [Thermaerobacter sp.]